MLRIALLVVGFLLLTGPTLAQSVGEKLGVNSTLGIPPKAADFVKEAAAGNMFEMQSSQIAVAKSQGDVQTFANQMLVDHGKIFGELQKLAQDLKILLPRTMSSSQQNMLDKLRVLNGKDFAHRYVDDQVLVHKQAVSLFQRYAKNGDNDQLKAWANQTLPTLQQHFDMAQNLAN
jgi:putative membrane protein